MNHDMTDKHYIMKYMTLCNILYYIILWYYSPTYTFHI